MPISIVCPGCKKRFQVRDEFAGKSGPCPTCKTIIKIPTKAEEVTIHAPEGFGGSKGVTGKLTLKPIAREEVRVKPVAAVAIVASVLIAFGLAWFGRTWISDPNLVPGILARGLGLLLISPPLCVAAYTFLREAELEPHRGKMLYLRAAICSTVYILLWALFAYLKFAFPPVDIWQWAFIAPPILGMGTLAGWLAFDLDPANGFFHYAFYASVTSLLGWVGGLGWIWQVPPPS
jgi:hypothetical protein